jgi:hypothetical protein
VADGKPMDGLYYIIVLEWFTVNYKKTHLGPKPPKIG